MAALRLGHKTLAFSENRPSSGKPIFCVLDNSRTPLIFINHIETIP
jgi:hypothetical protein